MIFYSSAFFHARRCKFRVRVRSAVLKIIVMLSICFVQHGGRRSDFVWNRKSICITISFSNAHFHFNFILANLSLLRPVPNVALLPCRTKFKNLIRLKHGSSTTFETIKFGKLSSARLFCTAGPVVPHGSSATWFQTACFCRAELNSCMYFGLFCPCCTCFVVF